MELTTLRCEIDAIDRELLTLYLRRATLSDRIGAYKKSVGAPVYQPERETEKLRALTAGLSAEEAAEVEALFRTLFLLSRKRQEAL